MPQIDFVPLLSYTLYFEGSILIWVLFLVFLCHRGIVLEKETTTWIMNLGKAYVIVLILYMGLRPISSVFGDTVNYAVGFRKMAASDAPFQFEYQREWIYYNLMQLFAKFSNIHAFYLLCATVYVGSLALAMKRIFHSYYFIPMLVVMSMFTFWAYGVNGVRNGMGASLFILAMTYVDNLPVAILLCLLGCGMHQSTWLMVAAAIVAWFVKNSRCYLVAWVLCVVVSYFWGGPVQDFLSQYAVFGNDSRMEGYLTGEGQIGEIVQMEMKFHWDFLIYSSMGVAVGYYFTFVRKFEDEYYHWIFNIYLLTNALWVLVIRAIYSNRFAQISWFILPLVLIYPFMKKRFWDNHEKMLGYALMAFYAFSFYYNILRPIIL